MRVHSPYMNLFKFLPLCMLAACASTPQIYKAEQPSMDFITYFTGTSHGYGAIYGFTGKVTDRFHVLMQGTAGKDAQGRRTLELAEDFTYASGKTQKRGWAVTEIAPGQLVASAPDVPNGATGDQSGNAVQFRYKMDIPRDNGKTITLAANDWMWRLPDTGTHQVILNRNTLSKFGIPVAELVITFVK